MTDDLKIPFVSVVIVNWNRCEDILFTLRKVETIDYPNKEIIIVDNGSSDNSVQKIRTLFPSVKLISLPVNIGCEDGNNVGILNSSGEIILFLDSDADIDSENFSNLIKEFDRDQSIGIVEPRIIRPSDLKILNEAQHWPIRNTFTGCVVAIKAEVFDRIGLRPGEFFLYSSEPDIALKTIEHGYKIVHCSNIIGHHRESAKARASKQFYYFATRNLIWLIWRHYPIKSAIYETCFLIIIHFVRSIKDLAFINFLRGLFVGLFNIRVQAFNKRKPIKKFQEARVFPSFNDLLKIIYNKFIKNKGI